MRGALAVGGLGPLPDLRPLRGRGGETITEAIDAVLAVRRSASSGLHRLRPGHAAGEPLPLKDDDCGHTDVGVAAPQQADRR